MRKHRILVADDNADSADSFAVLLTLEGHDVRCVYDGADALSMYDKFRPDVVILDISMPGLGGREVARLIRAHDPERSVLLLALSGWTRNEDVESSIASGFDHHFVKPVELAAVAALL